MPVGAIGARLAGTKVTDGPGSIPESGRSRLHSAMLTLFLRKDHYSNMGAIGSI
jgi:hypothetical protein